jgi:hypothetical protein
MSAAGGMYAGGDVSPDIKVITNASIYSAAATTAPCIAMLVDLLGFYRITSVTATTAQTLDNSVTIPRYTTGAGVQAFAWANNSVALGAATPTITITYTNSDGVSGQTNPSPLPSCKTAAPNGKILYSGTGSGKYGPFIPLKAADKGVRSIQTMTLSASYLSGEFSIGLCRPLITLPITTVGVASERDFVNQLPSLPRVYDGACLIWLLYSGAATPANSSFYGHVDFAWG